MIWLLGLALLGQDLASHADSKTKEDCEKDGGSWMSLAPGKGAVCGDSVAEIEARRKICPNFDKVLKSAHLKNAKGNEWIVSEIKSGSLWQKRGFLDGDKLIKIDGRTIKTPKDVTKVHMALCKDRGSEVAIKRGERLIILSW